MRDYKTEIMIAIEWGIVPLILVGLLALFLVYTPEKNTPKKILTSNASGKVAGLLVFALFILSQKSRALSFSLKMPPYDFNISIIVMAVASGFIVSSLFHLVKNKIYIGVYTLVAIASASIAIYVYLFIENMRGTLIFVTIGVMLGALLYTIFFPNQAKPDKALT
jgi:hypothetical protein